MDVKEALMELAEAVKRILNDRIKKYGVNRRIGKNTLEGSDLQKSIQVKVINEGIELQIADYWEFISRGWVRTRNYPGTLNQFVKNVTDWVRKKNIKFGDLKENQIVFLVVKKIFENGIQYRPFMIYDNDGDLSEMMPEVDKYIDTWFDHLYYAIMVELDNYFND